MLSQFAAIALSLAATAPIDDWYYVDADKSNANITFIDKSSIHENGDGFIEATMFSVLAQDVEGSAAFRFIVEYQCDEALSRLKTGEPFTATLKSSGVADMGADWEANDPGTQGETFVNFVCTKGATSPNSTSLGNALPLAKGRAMLAERVAKASK